MKFLNIFLAGIAYGEYYWKTEFVKMKILTNFMGLNLFSSIFKEHTNLPKLTKSHKDFSTSGTAQFTIL